MSRLSLLSVFICFHLWLFTLFPSVANAHTARMTSALAQVAPGGDVKISITLDVLSYALNDTSQRIPDKDMDALLDGPESDLRDALADATDRLLHGVRLAQGGTIDSVTFPTVADLHAYLAKDPKPRLPVVMTATLHGHLPPAAREFSARFPQVLGTVVLTVERPADEPAAVAPNPGDWSDPVPIHLNSSAAPTTSPTADSSRGGVGGTAVPSTSASPSFATTFFEFIHLGYTHILPEGLDHILFVLGLFLLSTQLKPLLFQVTCFTVAHSITLALAMYGVFRLPSSVVEPLIAASIAFVAIENLFTNKLHPWRPFVVFGFGLIHGLGFSAALTDLHLTRAQFLPALVGFNGGVELGQLTVIAGAFALVGWFRTERWYRPTVAIPASLVIASVGLFWTVQRIVAP